MIRVFKFGGASIANANGFKNVAEILKQYQKENLVLVISALGKTTNALENIVQSYFKKDGKCFELLNELRVHHYRILSELFEDKSHAVFSSIHNTFAEIEWIIEDHPSESYDYVYDQIVSIGELASTIMATEWFNLCGLNVEWLDAREFIKTDNTYREGKVSWNETERLINEKIKFNSKNNIKLTQGFIGCTTENFTTTLGREGSDYTAAILAYSLNAKDVTIWKDVPGVLNADPRYFSNAKLIEQLSYREAIEMTYYGATVIHPKTLKPLQNKLIPLNVRSFIVKDKTGTVISELQTENILPSIRVKKINQALISIAAKDFSFVAEDNISEIFQLIANCHVKVNMMQNSALSFSVCVDNAEDKLEKLIQLLEANYKVRCNYNLSLLTVRHYSDAEMKEELKEREIVLEQKSRTTIQVVFKD